MTQKSKRKNLTLTAKRIEAIEFIIKHPNCFVGYVAENVLAQKRTRLWSQAATRMGAAYCIQLETMGLVAIDRHTEFGYGRVSVTDAGRQAVACHQAAERLADEDIAAVIARCVE